MTDPNDSIVSNDELQDGTEEASLPLVRVDTKVLTSPVVLGALGGLTVGLVLLVWPDRSDRVLARLIGLGLIWAAAVGLRSLLRWRGGLRSAGWAGLLGPLVLLVSGGTLVWNPERSTVFVARLVGALLLLRAARIIVGVLRSPDRNWRRVPFVGVEAATGLMLLLVTGALLSAVLSLTAMVLVGLSALVLVVSLDPRTEGAATYQNTTDLVLAWLRERPKSVDARQALYDKILYEGPPARTRIIRFFTLMGFASVIASMGVISDSTAVVIGAMLVAPLMTPLMGMAISLVMGWPNRLARASALAFAGITFAIAIGVLLGLTVPTTIDTATNAQILARSSPTVLDLITAVAAGGAGAYGLSRPDVSDSLPGVAIAISLVPPLTVVGIALSQGDVISSFGALLLFATNMVAILIVGGLTFVLTGVTPIDHAAGNQSRVRTAIGATLTGAVLVLGALLLNGAEIATDVLQQSTVEEEVAAWLVTDDGAGPETAAGGDRFRLVEARIQGDVVTAVIVGPSTGVPDVQALADRLSAQLAKPISVEVSLVVEERLSATANG